MKLRVRRLCIVVLAILLVGCQKKSSSMGQTNYSLSEILDTMIASQENIDLIIYEQNSERYETQIKEQYAFTADDTQISGIIGKSLEASADEIAVFLCRDGKTDPESIRDVLNQYIVNRKVDFLGYAPYEVEKLDNSKVLTNGNYVALIICSQTDAAVDAFNSCFTENKSSIDATETPTLSPTSTPTPAIVLTATPEPTATPSVSSEVEVTKELYDITYSLYDNHTIVEAYKAKDSSLLTNDIDLAVYNKCVEIMDEVITDSMDDYEKELAIHDYLINWAEYDKVALKDESTHSEYAEQPYGLLLKQYAICSGYTTTFQLFMDMLDIPCLSIPGHSGLGNATELEDHAWNMIMIDNTWYYVDVTWDDPYYGDDLNHPPRHDFFNTTTAYMMITGHRWDDDKYPMVKKTGMRKK